MQKRTEPRHRAVWETACLVAAVVLAYLPATIGEFVWDDDAHVSQNIALRSLKGLGWIWTHVGATPQYYPLTHTTFWLQYQAWGANPLPYHLLNILLHAGSAVLLWRILLKLGVPAAFFAAVLFAIHPIQTESVAWISKRKNTLSVFLYLCAMSCAVRAFLWDAGDAPAADSRRPRMGWYAAMLACALAAVLSKTVAGSLPAALVIIAWWKRGRLDWRLIAWLTPLWVLAIIFSQITAYMERTIVGAVGPEWQFTFVDRILIAGRAVVHYVSKILLPVDLMFMYPRWVINSGRPLQWLFPAAVVAVVAAIWFGRTWIGRGAVAAFGFFLITVFPALGFVNIYPMRYAFVADHFVYLASVGIFILVAAGLERSVATLANGRAIRTAVGSVLAIGLMTLTFLQSQTFASPEALWTDVLKKNPSSPIALNQMGMLAMNAQHLSEAEEWYRRALKENPEQTESMIGLSRAHWQRGDREAAIAIARDAVRVRPNKIGPLEHLAGLLHSSHPDEAIATLQQLLQNNQDYEPARMSLAKLLALSGRIPDAIAQCQRAIELRPQSTQARVLLGDLYWNQRNASAARRAYEGALTTDPQNQTIQRRIDMTRQ